MVYKYVTIYSNLVLSIICSIYHIHPYEITNVTEPGMGSDGHEEEVRTIMEPTKWNTEICGGFQWLGGALVSFGDFVDGPWVFFVQIEQNVHGWFLWLKFIAKARENSFSPSVIIQMLVKSCLLTRSRCPKRGWSLSLPANLRRWCWCYCCLLFRIKIYVRCSTKGRFSWHFHPAGGHASLGRDIFATGRCGNWEAGKVRYYFRADVWEKIGRNQKNTKMNGALITC